MFSLFFGPPFIAMVAYHPERSGMPFHDVVGDTKKGANTDVMAAKGLA